MYERETETVTVRVPVPVLPPLFSRNLKGGIWGSDRARGGEWGQEFLTLYE